MKRIFWIAFLIFLIFVISVAVYDPLREQVKNILVNVIGAPAVAGFSNFASTITANPIYQQYHVLLWIVGGVVLTISFQQLRSRGKIPLLRPKATQTQLQPAVMGPPQSIIVRETPVSTRTQQAPVEPQLPVEEEAKAPA